MNATCAKSPKHLAGYASNIYGFKCGVCKHYTTNNACTIVEGKILPQDCCNLFDSKTFKPARKAKKVK